MKPLHGLLRSDMTIQTRGNLDVGVSDRVRFSSPSINRGVFSRVHTRVSALIQEQVGR